MQANKELKDLTIEELESLCYRQLKLLQQTQTNIQILEQEINKRNELKKEEV